MVEAPPFPVALAYLIEFLPKDRIEGWFAELSAARASSGFAPSPISYGEIESWSRLTGRCPTPFEVRLLRALDNALLNAKPPRHGDENEELSNDEAGDDGD